MVQLGLQSLTQSFVSTPNVLAANSLTMIVEFSPEISSHSCKKSFNVQHGTETQRPRRNLFDTGFIGNNLGNTSLKVKQITLKNIELFCLAHIITFFN
jgi:hypothetical protein